MAQSFRRYAHAIMADMFLRSQAHTRGFTLIEIIVVIGIIGMLAGIALASMSSARASARDKERIATVAQLQLAMRLYVEQHGSDIDCEGGVKFDGISTYTTSLSLGPGCADGQQILDFVDNYFGKVPADPRGSGNSDFYYYFDNRHTCSALPGGYGALVWAANLEHDMGNVNPEICGDQLSTNNDGGFSSTSSYDPSQPHVRTLDFTTR
jgi:prepilin-type N-terminal cleavage/methylation domain-containing protein